MMENNDSVQLDKSLNVSWCNDRRGGSAGATDVAGGRSSISSSSASGRGRDNTPAGAGSVKSSSTSSRSVSLLGDLYAGGGDPIVPTELFAT